MCDSRIMINRETKQEALIDPCNQDEAIFCNYHEEVQKSASKRCTNRKPCANCQKHNLQLN